MDLFRGLKQLLTTVDVKHEGHDVLRQVISYLVELQLLVSKMYNCISVTNTLTSSAELRRSASSCHAPQFHGQWFTLFRSHAFASTSFLPFNRTMPYRYSRKPCDSFVLWRPPRALRCSSRMLDILLSSLFKVTEPSVGPKIISLSSSFRFSPATYFAYKARKSERWLSCGIPGKEFVDFGLLFVVTFNGSRVIGSWGTRLGSKVAAHLSNSRQSKKDLAMRNLGYSLRSRRASCPSCEN